MMHQPDTDSSTPPLQEVPQRSNLQMMQRIINSNEDLIQMQGMRIKCLQLQNQQIKQKLQQAERKYVTLLEFAKKEGDEEMTVIDVEAMLEKIIALQSMLSTSKVQFALASSELLSNQLHKHASIEETLQSINISKENIDKFVVIGQNKNGQQYLSKKGKHSEDDEALIQQWNKALDLYVSQNEGKQSKFKEKTIGIVKKFIPHQLRQKIWPIIFQNVLGLSNALYIQLLERRANGWISEKVKSQIQKDINRSFSGKTQYTKKTGLSIQVCEILQIFHIYRPDVSYVQGMTYPAIILVLVVGKIRAFRIFSNLILANSFFRKLFTFQGNFVAIVARAFQLLLQEYTPEIYKKLQEMKLQSEIYLIQWMFTFFSRGLSFNSTLRYWDNLAYLNELAVFRLALSIFEIMQSQLLQSSYQECISSIREFGDHVDEVKLMEMFVNHKLSEQKLWKTLEKAQKKIGK